MLKVKQKGDPKLRNDCYNYVQLLNGSPTPVHDTDIAEECFDEIWTREKSKLLSVAYSSQRAC